MCVILNIDGFLFIHFGFPSHHKREFPVLDSHFLVQCYIIKFTNSQTQFIRSINSPVQSIAEYIIIQAESMRKWCQIHLQFYWKSIRVFIDGMGWGVWIKQVLILSRHSCWHTQSQIFEFLVKFCWLSSFIHARIFRSIFYSNLTMQMAHDSTV